MTAFSLCFDCMMGPNTDTDHVIIVESGCDNKAGVSSATVALHKATQRSGHSDGTGGSWTYSGGTGGGGRPGGGRPGGGSGTLTYTAPEGAQGLLYICANGGTYTTGNWSDGSILTHSNSHTGQWHCQIAPVYDKTNVVVGS